MKKIKEALTNRNITTAIALSSVVLLSLLGFIIYKYTRDYTVKEVLFDTQRGKLYIVRDDGKETDAGIEIITGGGFDITQTNQFYRRRNYLIHQILSTEQENTGTESTVYTVSPDGLNEVFKKDVSILDYTNEKNYIYATQEETVVVKNGELKAISTVCREAVEFNGSLVCVTSSSRLVYGDPESLETGKTQDGRDVRALTLAVDEPNELLYVATVIKDDQDNDVYTTLVMKELSETLSSVSEYRLTAVPALIVVQENRVVLNALTKPQFQHYMFDDGINLLKGYRYTLLIVY